MELLVRYSRAVLILLGAVVVTAVGATFDIPPADPSSAGLAPSWTHLLGTSPYGHDMLRLTIVATLRACAPSVWASCVTVTLGVLIGTLAAWSNDGVWDQVQSFVGRLLDALGIFLPAACLATLASTVTVWELAPALALFAWPNLSNVVRSETLRARRLPFVEAAEVIGVGPARLTLFYVLPEMLDRLLPPVIAMIGGFVGVFGALQFLGVGITEEMSLGFMVYDGSQNYLRSAPWYFGSSVGGFVGLLVVVSFAAVYARTAERRISRDQA